MEIADDFYTCIVHHTDFEEAITLVKPNIKEATDATDHSGDVPNNDAPPSAGAQDPSVRENEPVSILNDPTRIEMFQTFTPGFLHFKRSSDISYSALLDETEDFTLEDCEETVKSAYVISPFLCCLNAKSSIVSRVQLKMAKTVSVKWILTARS